MEIENYVPPSPAAWHGRQDDGEGHRRFFHAVRCIDLEKERLPQGNGEIAIIGFACDEGINRNQGRPGAFYGPEAFRQALANFPCHLKEFIDAGDVQCLEGKLEEAQLQLGGVIADLRKSGYFPLVVGGGHETAWGHYQGLTRDDPVKNLTVVNIDAHFDLRDEGGHSTSGTSFLQIANDRKGKGLPFHYYCLGLQEMGNTAALFEQAKALDVQYISAELLHQQGAGALDGLAERLSGLNEGIYLTICLDVFSASLAPGVSAPQILGIFPWHILPFVRRLAESGKVLGFDIVELSPRFDNERMTAKLAASLASAFIHSRK